MKTIYVLVLAMVMSVCILGQQKDKAVFVEPKSEYWEQIQNNVKEFNTKETPAAKSFKVDFTGMDIPKSKDEFTSYWHNEPTNQGVTGTCWSFSTTSFFESEIYRLSKQKIKLSQMYTAYWEYIEKARGFVQTRGKSVFGEGSQSNAVIRVWKKYGIVPLEAYSGKLPGQKSHDHSKMYEEMNNYLKSVKAMNAWDEETVVSTIKSILNSYMQAPPEFVNVDGKKYSPKEYLEKVTKLNLNDYYEFLSFMEYPYYTYAEYKVEDNWWHSKEYYNIPLDEFTSIIKNAIQKGFTVSIAGDVSEPGIESHSKVAIIPTFDIPSQYIDENSRQFRFTNGTSTDDHGIHIVGYENKNGKDWYLIKDSGSGAFNTGDKGYYFYSADYIKLKTLACLMHKDALGDYINKIK
ncbi:MAG: C1 family peptidase [Bacteroidota bacterium]|nr:C1 family peptidase [Bacteroidota bacterium]